MAQITSGSLTIVDVTDGAAGLNNTTVFLYRRATSAPNKPTGNLTYTFATALVSGDLEGWKQSINDLANSNDPIWMIAAVASSNSKTDVIESSDWAGPIKMAQNGQDGQPGMPGTNGLNQATIFIYKRDNIVITPSKTTYIFATGDFTVPFGWSKTIPSEPKGKPCWITSAIAIGAEATAELNWVEPSVLVEDGSDGISPTVTATENGVKIVDAGGNETFIVNGADGTSYYTFVRYSENADGSEYVAIPTSETIYIGVYTGTKSSPPAYNDSGWTWSRYVGADGQPGTPGTQGPQGISVTATRELYYLKTNTTDPTRITDANQIHTTDDVNQWTSIVPTYIGSGKYYTCIETTLSNDNVVWSAPVENKGLTDANVNAANAIEIARGVKQHFFWVATDKSESIPAGAYVAEQSEESFYSNPTKGNILTRSDGIWIRNGVDKLATLQGSGLTFLVPTGTYKGQKSVSLNGSGLTFYNIGSSNSVAATLASDGLQITNGSIILGTTGGTAAGNVTLSNKNFKRSINGTNYNDLRFAVGSKFGVASDGTLYASGANIQGQVTITAGSNVYTKDEVDDAVGDTATDLANYILSNDKAIDDLEKQIDGAIDTWYYNVDPTTSNEPAKNWTTDALKESHLRDLYFNTSNGHTFRWAKEGNTYKWIQIEDADAIKALADAAKAQSTADVKRRVFITTPTTPYDIGDLWVGGSKGDIKKCKTAKTKNQSYAAADWELASKYTDNTALNNFKSEFTVTPAEISSEVQATKNGETLVTRINQTADTVKIEAKHVEIDGAATFSAIKSSADASYDAKGAANTAKNEAISAAAEDATSKANAAEDNAKAAIPTKVSQLNNDSNYQTNSQVSTTVTNATKDKADKSELPTKVSQLSNDSGYQNSTQVNTAVTTAVNNIEIGGRNLLFKEPYQVTPTGYLVYRINSTIALSDLSVGDKITFQLWGVNVDTNSTQVVIYWGGGSIKLGGKLPDENGYISFTYTVTSAHKSHAHATNKYIYIYNFPSGHADSNLTIERWKLEKGNKATDWTPAPEDVDADILDVSTVANNAAPKDSAVKRTQRIYYQSNSTSPPGTPGTKSANWVTDDTGDSNKWTKKRMSYSSDYKYIWTCEQSENAAGTVSYTTVLLDDSTTVIDGGNIITGTVTANAIKAGSLQLGKFTEEDQERIFKDQIEYIVGTQTASTNVWTGVSTSKELYAGKTIAYYLPHAGNSSAATLNLTLADGTKTGAKNVRWNNTNVTTHYPAYSVITMTFDGEYWKTAAYNSDTTNRTRWQNIIAAAEAITAAHIICGTEEGYQNIAAGVSFDLTYPLLYANRAIAKGATSGTRDDNYLEINDIKVSNNGTIESAAVNKVLYLKGTLSGNSFTIAEAPFMTTEVHEEDDGYRYIPLGIMYSTTNIYFRSSDQVYAYIEGAFGPISLRYANSVNATASGAASIAETAASDILTINGAINSTNANIETIEQIVGSSKWVTGHGFYVKTTDTTPDYTKDYYTITATAVTDPTGNPHRNLYYEKTNNVYVLTTDNVVASSKTYYRLVATRVDSPTGNPSTNNYYEQQLAESIQDYLATRIYSEDSGLYITDGSISKVQVNSTGVSILVGDTQVASYGAVAQIGSESGFHIKIGGANNEIGFYNGPNNKMAYINGKELYVVNSLSFGSFTFYQRPNGHFTLKLV